MAKLLRSLGGAFRIVFMRNRSTQSHMKSDTAAAVIGPVSVDNYQPKDKDARQGRQQIRMRNYMTDNQLFAFFEYSLLFVHICSPSTVCP
jgi:hypothetical protein